FIGVWPLEAESEREIEHGSGNDAAVILRVVDRKQGCDIAGESELKVETLFGSRKIETPVSSEDGSQREKGRSSPVAADFGFIVGAVVERHPEGGAKDGNDCPSCG